MPLLMLLNAPHEAIDFKLPAPQARAGLAAASSIRRAA